MDLHTAIRERRSCRNYLPDAISKENIEQILEAATWAPSPANNQPWEFIVITGSELKAKIFAEAETRRQVLYEKSGWKWLNRYEVGFLKEVPVILAVVGDPKKTGADMFLKDGGMAYQLACAAAIQNILLTAHSLSLGSLWFTLFEKDVTHGDPEHRTGKRSCWIDLYRQTGRRTVQNPQEDCPRKDNLPGVK